VTKKLIHAAINDSGDLIITTIIVGGGPELESRVTVLEQNKDAVLLCLIDALFGGKKDGANDFRAWLTLKDIPSKSDSYSGY
jgi:hypothetical protein